jgi:hypothetical protein
MALSIADLAVQRNLTTRLAPNLPFIEAEVVFGC